MLRGEAWVRKNGVLIRRERNLIVTAGFTLIANILGAAVAKPSHMAIGQSSVTTTLDMTALQGTEHQRLAAVISVNGRTVSYAATFGPGLGSDVTAGEFGIFNAAAAGTMLCRFTTLAFTVGPDDNLEVTWQVTIGD